MTIFDLIVTTAREANKAMQIRAAKTIVAAQGGTVAERLAQFEAQRLSEGKG